MIFTLLIIFYSRYFLEFIKYKTINIKWCIINMYNEVGTFSDKNKKTILKLKMIKNRMFLIFLDQEKASLSLKKIVQKVIGSGIFILFISIFFKLKLLV